MIHVRAQAEDHNAEPVLHISLVGTAAIQKFRTVLGKVLNCNPDFGDDWFALSDKVDQFLAVPDTSIPPG